MTRHGRTLRPASFWTTNAMAAGAFGLTLLFFFSIPRVGVGLLQHSHGESLRTTGFSEQVDLGVMGPVKQDPSIVMRVELPDSPGTPLHGAAVSPWRRLQSV
ncbi:MAG: DUF3488 domain-containing protein [Nitrospira sp.]|nr:DUF3488 domain-containing protein [Nitrospira sp.]